jgi:hypothetical protein
MNYGHGYDAVLTSFQHHQFNPRPNHGKIPITADQLAEQVAAMMGMTKKVVLPVTRTDKTTVLH